MSGATLGKRLPSMAAPARGRAAGIGAHAAGRDDAAGAGRSAARGRHGQRRRPPDPRQPSPDRRPAHVARATPATTTTTCRSSRQLLGETSTTRGRLRQHEPGRARRPNPAVPGIWGPVVDGRRDGARRLVSAAEDRRRLRADRYGCFGPAAGEVCRDASSVSRRSSTPRRPAARGEGPRCSPAGGRSRPLTVLAAVLRFSTLDLQSLWYDEAFTPVHVLHAGLGATLHAVVHSENTPPLWYVLEWADLARARHRRGRAAPALGARRGRDRAGRLGDRARARPARRAAIACAAFVAVNPLFVWYSQEARAYGLFVLCRGAGDAVLPACAARADAASAMAAFALSRVAGAADPLLRGVPARADGAVAARASRARRRAALPARRGARRSSAWRCCR